MNLFKIMKTILRRKHIEKNGFPAPSEHQEARALMQWVGANQKTFPELDLLFHIPNGGQRGIVAASKLKAEGTKKGIPDYMLPVSRGGFHGLFLELKKREGGVVSKEQIRLIAKLSEQGYLTVVVKGWEEASRQLVGYLSLLPESRPPFS